MIQRYEKTGHVEAVRKLEESYHAKLLEHDDVIVVATSHDGKWTWGFEYDRDVSDCSLSRTRGGDAKGVTRDHPVLHGPTH